MARCLSCARGLYKECGHDPPQESTDTETISPDRRPRSLKRDDALKDQQSTGRKRAARLFPLEFDSLCEWWDASPENPKGGGEFPITFGCRKLQVNRHHGPDKNTLNNDNGNVHRICSWHHNNWHSRNDPSYDPNKPLKD